MEKDKEEKKKKNGKEKKKKKREGMEPPTWSKTASVDSVLLNEFFVLVREGELGPIEPIF